MGRAGHRPDKELLTGMLEQPAELDECKTNQLSTSCLSE